jgi:excisionase family DNA binding protein
MKASEPVLITVEEMAARLSIGRTIAWELVRQRKIKSVKIGRTRRVPLTAIAEYVARLIESEEVA